MVSCFFVVNNLSGHLRKQKFISESWKCHIDCELWLVDFDLCLFVFFGGLLVVVVITIHLHSERHGWGGSGLDFQRGTIGVQISEPLVKTFEVNQSLYFALS